MRNLKKVLAMALALVMSLSLVTIANAADFSDDADISYKEAVDVMSAIGVINGYEDGSFQPEGVLTREEAAKLICTMLLGDSADRLGTTSSSFTDVAATRWSSPFIEYCNSLGIIAGNGDGTFDPTGELTGHAFAKMLLVALGYDSAREGYTGAGWSINVASDAVSAGIDVDGVAMSAPVTREVAAQMAFQTLEATMVEYATAGTVVTTPDGTTVVTGGSTASRVEADSGDNYITGAANDTFKQFCEEYFSDLEKIANDTDDFGRPGTGWEYDNDPVAFGADEPVAVFDGEDFDFDDDLEDYDVVSSTEFLYNGSALAGFDGTSATTRGYFDGAKGVQIEAYADDDDNLTDVVVIEYYVAQIDSIDLNDDDEVESVDMVVYEAGQSISHASGTDKYGVTITVDVEDDEDAYAMIQDYEEDDVFMACLMGDWELSASDIDDKLLAVDDVDVISGEVTAMNTSTSGGHTSYNSSWLRIDGERYYFASEYSRATIGRGSDGAFYLYNGYVVHFDGSVGEADDNYLFVVRGSSETDRWDAVSAYAEVVFLDGTSEVVYLNVDDSDGLTATTSGSVITGYTVTPGIYSYEYDEDDDEYTLTDEDDTPSTIDFTNGSTRIGSTARANSATVFVYIDLTSGGAVDDVNVYTGYRNAPSKEVTGTASATNGAYLVYEDGSNTTKCIFVVGGTSTSGSDDVIFIAGASVSGVIDDSDVDKTYYLYNAVVDGEIVEIMVNSTMANANNLTGVYNNTATDSDGVYTTISWTAPDADEFGSVNGGNFGRAEDDVITIGGETLAYADDVQVFVANADGDITTGSINRNYSNVNIRYFMNSDGEVDLVFIQRLS